MNQVENCTDVEMKNAVVCQSKLSVITKDGVIFHLDKNVAKMSGLIKDMVEDEEENEIQESIPLPQVDAVSFKAVIEYCEYHYTSPAEEIEKPLKGKVEDVICEFDKKFLQKDLSMITNLIQTANYLNIKCLLDLLCAKVASEIKGKSGACPP